MRACGKSGQIKKGQHNENILQQCALPEWLKQYRASARQLSPPPNTGNAGASTNLSHYQFLILPNSGFWARERVKSVRARTDARTDGSHARTLAAAAAAERRTSRLHNQNPVKDISHTHTHTQACARVPCINGNGGWGLTTSSCDANKLIRSRAKNPKTINVCRTRAHKRRCGRLRSSKRSARKKKYAGLRCCSPSPSARAHLTIYHATN